METQNIDVPGIVREYFTVHGNSCRAFRDALSADIYLATNHASVANWLKGKNVPDVKYLIWLASATKDWRREFAIRLLKLIDPVTAEFVEKLADPCAGQEAEVGG